MSNGNVAVATDGFNGISSLTVDPAEVKGPQFMDSGKCRCALQTSTGISPAAWRCIGDFGADIYSNQSGIWFHTTTNRQVSYPSTTPSLDNLGDASDPLDNSTTFVYDFGGGALVPLNSDNNKTLSIFDQACTGQNETASTQRFYNILNENESNAKNQNFDRRNPPVAKSGLVCVGGTTPVLVQNATAWADKGCYPGFICPNNTVNALPQYCVPVVPCQLSRLSGFGCPPEGLYEPFLCPEGMYCPAQAKAPIDCPSGHFCPQGSVEPLPCTGGARCPQNSTYNQPLAPIALLIIWDVFLIVLFLVMKWFHNRKTHRSTQVGTMMSYLTNRKINASGYVVASPTPGHSRQNSAWSHHSDELEMDSRITFGKSAEGGYYNDRDLGDTASIYSSMTQDLKEPQNDLEAFVASLSRCIQGSTFGLSFQFSNLSYQPKGSQKAILSDINGQIRNGSLVGVMGGSGAGKSTFVNVLMGKRPHTSGDIQINGVSGKVAQYKKIIGYVPQDDILLSELTVRENILHSARIRLPSSWSDKEIQKHVDILLQALKLDHVRDNIVGSVGKPGVSGGQRKRVSIGMELAAAPMAIFLDEPTSGLDATAASSIMELLKALSRVGITIVTIIHQPRQEIFESLDDLILLGNGRMLYEGATAGVAEYFNGCGFHFPRSQNPADVIMDIINGEGRQYKRVGDTSINALIENWHSRTAGQPHIPTVIPPQDEIKALRRSIRKRGAPWPKQIWLCFTRAMLQQYRFAQSFWFEMGVATLAGLLIGLAENSEHGNNFRGFYRDDYKILSSSQDVNSIGQLALLVGIAIGLVAASPAVKVFGEERLMFYREAAAGHNRLAYYIGKVISTLPRMALGCIHFTTLFMLLATPRMRWLEALIANFLYFWCIYGLASIISMVTRREDGPLLAVMSTLIVGTLCGMAPTLKTVEGWHLGWLWRASPGTWLSEYYYIQNVWPWVEIYDVEAVTDVAVGFTLSNSMLDLIVLFAIGAVYRVLAFLAMRFLNTSKQR